MRNVETESKRTHLTEHDQELHQVVVDGAASGLDDKHVLVAHTVANLNIGFLISKL